MRSKLAAFALPALLVVGGAAIAAQGVFVQPGVLVGPNGALIPGNFEMPYDTGPPPAPPTFMPPQRFRPNGGGAPIPLGGPEEYPVTAVQGAGVVYHFSIFRDPAKPPNVTTVKIHYDYNGNGVEDPGEPIRSNDVVN